MSLSIGLRGQPHALIDLLKSQQARMRKSSLSDRLVGITQLKPHHLSERQSTDREIIASLCGHYEIVEFLLESGAQCDRDTFQGERAVYSALNDRIRQLLLRYDYSVAMDRNQPYAALITSLLSSEVTCSGLTGIVLPRPMGDTILELEKHGSKYKVHSFVLAARSEYFRNSIIHERETQKPELMLPSNTTSHAISCMLKYMYLHDTDTIPWNDGLADPTLLARSFGISGLHETVGQGKKRQQKRATTIETAQQDFLRLWNQYLNIPLSLSCHEHFSPDKLDSRLQSLRPDVILRVESQQDGLVYFYGAHKAVLQSDFICTAIRFKERFQKINANDSNPVLISVDVSPWIMESILKWFYTDTVDIEPGYALDLLMAADMLLSDRLKTRACLLISTQDRDDLLTGDLGYSVFDVARAGWVTGMSLKLDPFCARFLASRLEHCLDTASVFRPQLEELIKESAERIESREETDTVELVDDIRYYLNERFRMRFDALPEGMFSDTEEQGELFLDPDQKRMDIASETPRTNSDEYARLMADLDKLLETLGLDI
ncbi:hypothetical protein TWF694_010664 [Orbilia ellipsospora]|uniref:BTB domain-containing protein n=1 Tax=Orbilia ellipsospora TaxID=2528407 RepID=A0AAV9X7V1_9PEZI